MGGLLAVLRDRGLLRLPGAPSRARARAGPAAVRGPGLHRPRHLVHYPGLLALLPLQHPLRLRCWDRPRAPEAAGYPARPRLPAGYPARPRLPPPRSAGRSHRLAPSHLRSPILQSNLSLTFAIQNKTTTWWQVGRCCKVSASPHWRPSHHPSLYQI